MERRSHNHVYGTEKEKKFNQLDQKTQIKKGPEVAHMQSPRDASLSIDDLIDTLMEGNNLAGENPIIQS